MIGLFLRRYWQQIAVGLLALIILVMANVWLHHRDLEHERIGEERVQAKWNADKAAQAKKIIELQDQNAAITKERDAIAQKGNNERLALEKQLSDLRVADAVWPGRLRDAGADFQRRLGQLSSADACAATEYAAATFRGLLEEGDGLVRTGRASLASGAGDVRQRDQVIAADRVANMAMPVP